MIAAEGGDPDACRKLVEAFLPAINRVARGFDRSTVVEHRELLQEGVAGLLLAARRYDPGVDTPFWAYASFWVRKAMQELVADLSRPVALSDRAVRSLALIRAARSAHLQAHGTEPNEQELSTATGFTPAQLESLQAAGRIPEAAESIGDTIADPVAEEAYEQVLDDIEVHQVRDVADQLDERERSVLYAHYGLGQPTQTLTQIGGTLGLTGERARQIEAGALKKLREALNVPALATRTAVGQDR